MHRYRPLYTTLTIFVRRYELIHLTIGIIGNVLFVAGTILFIIEKPYAGWFFLGGSTGMLVNAFGNFLVKTEYLGKTAMTQIGFEVREAQRKKLLQKQAECDE